MVAASHLPGRCASNLYDQHLPPWLRLRQKGTQYMYDVISERHVSLCSLRSFFDKPPIKRSKGHFSHDLLTFSLISRDAGTGGDAFTMMMPCPRVLLCLWMEHCCYASTLFLTIDQFNSVMEECPFLEVGCCEKVKYIRIVVSLCFHWNVCHLVTLTHLSTLYKNWIAVALQQQNGRHQCV
jgi:hypothetical protein